MSGIPVRLCDRDSPSGTAVPGFTLPAIPRDGDLVKLPWGASRRVRRVQWDIDPRCEPVLIVEIEVW